MEQLRKLLSMMRKNERTKLVLLLLAVMVSALIETIGIASISPFLMVATDPNTIETNEFINKAYALSGLDSATEFIRLLGIISIILILSSNTFVSLSLWAQFRLAGNLSLSLSSRLMTYYVSRNYAFFLANNTAELQKNLITETDFVTASIFRPILRFASRTITSIAIIILLIVMDPLFALCIATGLGGAYFLLLLFIKKRIKKSGNLRAKANSGRVSAANELLSGIKDIKLLGREAFFLSMFKEAVHQYTRTSANTGFISEIPRYIVETLALATVLAVAIVYLSAEGSAASKIPAIGVYIYAGYRLLPNLQQVYAAYVNLNFGNAGLDNIYKSIKNIEDMETPTIYSVDSQRMKLRDNLSFKHLSFRYTPDSNLSLENINLTIKANSTIGIMGTTGSGKSTLADILLGLLTPDSGEFLIDGKTITPYNIRHWQNNIGYVPQTIYLSDNTIASNIALGIPDKEIDFKRLQKSTEIAQIHSFIETLPDGFNTHVGERGVRLSGGQIQRIGIARALYNDPDIIILDEATSALDTETEKALMDSVQTLHGEKTIIMIAHRLETLKFCNTVIELDTGKIKSITNT